jgi:transcription initiation factor TFIIE subunit alpha
MSEKFCHEVPSSLKQLARLVVRGFYSIEDALIVDMLVRNPCLKEEDISGEEANNSDAIRMPNV